MLSNSSSSPLPFDREYSVYIDGLQQLCQEAGDAILDHYHSEDASAHRLKGDRSPLTQADITADVIISQGLENFGLPVLSEESDEAIKIARRDWDKFWMVDPLDGTKEFLERTGEFTINIALIQQHRCELGVVYVPLQRKLYAGVPGQGAFILDYAGWREIRCRERPTTPNDLVVLTSRRHKGRELDSFISSLQKRGQRTERQYVGSALKFCQLAEGAADYYPRFSPCCEWDTAAGQALVEAAGGVVLDLQGSPLSYNKSDSLLNPYFVASSDPGVRGSVAGS